VDTHSLHGGQTIRVRAADLQRVGEELGLDAVGAAPAAPYDETERHIRDRKERGLFADMKFTMARPEESCHPELLLPGARTVVSAALCYYAPEPDGPRGHGGCRATRGSTRTRSSARSSTSWGAGSAARTASSSTRTSTSTGRRPRAAVSASTGRTRC
jgi:Uncharacterized Fe-S protein